MRAAVRYLGPGRALARRVLGAAEAVVAEIRPSAPGTQHRLYGRGYESRASWA